MGIKKLTFGQTADDPNQRAALRQVIERPAAYLAEAAREAVAEIEDRLIALLQARVNGIEIPQMNKEILELLSEHEAAERLAGHKLRWDEVTVAERYRGVGERAYSVSREEQNAMLPMLLERKRQRDVVAQLKAGKVNRCRSDSSCEVPRKGSRVSGQGGSQAAGSGSTCRRLRRSGANA